MKLEKDMRRMPRVVKRGNGSECLNPRIKGATERPAPVSGYVQELAEAGEPSDDEVMLVSYQYGAAARKPA